MRRRAEGGRGGETPFPLVPVGEAPFPLDPVCHNSCLLSLVGLGNGREDFWVDGKRLRTGAGPSTARAGFLGATSWGVEGTIEVLGLLAASKSGLVGGGTGVGKGPHQG